MSESPTLTSNDLLPPEIRTLCKQIRSVSDGLPVLTFVPNHDHSRLYQLVVVGEGEEAARHARAIKAWLEGQRIEPPVDALRQAHDLSLEAIHAAADYLPTIVFIPDGDRVRPVNLVPETVPAKLKPCYVAIQKASKRAIGLEPIDVVSQ